MSLSSDTDNRKPPDDREPPGGSPLKAAKKGLTTLSSVPMERITWAWEPWIARGKLTLVAGLPGMNKTTFTQDLAARISTGRPMPLAQCTDEKPADVIFYACEDSLSDITVPRLCAAGANTDRVHVYEEPIQIPRDIGIIEAHVAEKSALMVILDSLMSVLGVGIDSHRDAEVRRALVPLAKLAERFGVVVIGIVHPNKSQAGGSALQRLSGSTAFGAVARSVLIVGQAKDDECGRILAMSKANSGPKPRSLIWRIVPKSVPLADGTPGDSHPTIEWIGECDETADELMAPLASAEERSKLEDAQVFLREQLADGPVAYQELIERAKKESIAPGTLKRAKQSLKVRSDKTGAGWVWALPATLAPLAPLAPLDSSSVGGGSQARGASIPPCSR